MTKLEHIVRNVLWSLLAVTWLAACAHDDEPEEVFEGEYPSVKTQFAITVPLAEKSSRQPQDYIQQGEGAQFRGLDNVWLVPFNQKWTTASEQPIYRSRLIPLPSANGYTDATAHVKVYDNVVVPIGTRQFLFYSSSSQPYIGLGTEFFQTGMLKSTLKQQMNNISEIHFDLQPCFNDDMGNQESLWYKHANILINALNAVLDQLKAWKNSSNNARAQLYQNFLDLEAGSAFMIRESLKSLYEALQSKDVQVENDNSVAQIKNSILEGEAALFKNENFEWKDEYVDQLSKFPIPFALPIGAVQIKYNQDTGQMEYINLGKSPLPYAVKILDICYPPQLTYFAQTEIAVKDEKLDGWQDIWTATPAFTGWGDEVKLSTKTLALKEKVQYAVASMEAKFRCTSETLPHNDLLPVTVPQEGFPVTGILIGGQPAEVGWNFEPLSHDVNQFNCIVFDRMHNVKQDGNYVSGISAKSGSNTEWSLPNYTLLLKNKPMEKVSLLVELQNTSGQVIHGVDNGLIPVGAPFYLMAVLEPKEQITVDYGGGKKVTLEHPSLFLPDVTTQVKFKISSLKHAYLTIPDLRTTQMEVGMYVDLSWKKSRTITADIGE